MAIEEVKELASLDARINLLTKQADLLGEELRITSQRVNLFEKVKIPETRDNIRIIQIYLGDEQTAAVVRGKIAKKKLVRVYR
jgi:V/A-type H+-transporting ATPase subunit D